MKIIYYIIFLMCTFNTAYCQEEQFKDYGNKGHLFEILEVSVLEEIMSKLKEAEEKGEIQKLQKEFNDRVKAKILRPNPVPDIKKASINRLWTYSPTFTQETDIVNHEGRIIVKAGTTVNALDKFSWGEPLIFIDGDDDEQVSWVMTNHKSGKIVLVSGSPLELQKKINRPVFFDQGGILCRRFKIEAVPCVVEQEKGQKHLKINEVKI